MAQTRKLLRVVLEFMRELFGEKAYGHYCEHVSARGGRAMSAQEFYRSELERKYSRPCRCC